MPTLALLRHGQSAWNLENRFTGWVDVDLTDQGVAEATRGGELIQGEGLEFDRAYTARPALGLGRCASPASCSFRWRRTGG